jgi:hypothetical protein
MKPQCEFRKAEGVFVAGDDCFVGKWNVGNVSWNGRKSKGDVGNDYRATCRLPGIKPDLGAFDTEAEAQARLVRAVEFWFAKAVAA